MTDITRLNEELNQAILSGRAMEAFEALYADDVTMRENDHPPTVGKGANRGREMAFFDSVAAWHGARVVGSAVAGERSYTEFELDYSLKTGERKTYSQIAVRDWRNGRVSAERFYYGA